MLNFQEVDVQTFLKEYWQKKPFIFRKAIPNFVNPIPPDELAGLALEEDVESRIVIETPGEKKQWHLKNGPFSENDFKKLPKTNWTLLVQAVDRLIPEVYNLLDHFDFIPQWRIDDVMISFATLHGGVGPHYDNYDVFLYQAKGSRKWSLTTQKCTVDNYLQDTDLRIMKEFNTEEDYILEEGDMLYLPPHVGHYGISLSEECMTYSFGYRSYQGLELWDSLADYASMNQCFSQLYQDPDWSLVKNTSELNPQAWQQAQKLLLELIQDENLIKSWFGSFATTLDRQAHEYLPEPLDEDKASFLQELTSIACFERNPLCRFAYLDTNSEYKLYINGQDWPVAGVSSEVISLVANNRLINTKKLKKSLQSPADEAFIYELWKLQWLVSIEN